ncbi:MAG TPA: hypothetical protein VH044_18540 [Polyangiaceae bacterium]|nr:hypothetical protein [Polyangiaceae bacterium]
MIALILGSAGGAADVLRPLAGAPLLERQIEWLIMRGVSQVVVNNVVDAASSSARVDLGALASLVTWIPSASPLDARELAARAGVQGPVLLVHHAHLGTIDASAAFARFAAHGGEVALMADGCTLLVTDPKLASSRAEVLHPEGWLRDLRGEAACHRLAEAVLLGHVGGVVVRGTETSPGIWQARGSQISPGAVIEPPCYFGPESFVGDGARVGPGAMLGRRSVLERGGEIRHGRVADGVFVGQNVFIDHACATGSELEPFDGAPIPIDDPLLTTKGTTGTWTSVALAQAAHAALQAIRGPSVRTASPVDALRRVAAGSASWVGMDGESGGCIVDISPALLGANVTREARDAARALYRSQKGPLYDAALVVKTLLSRATKRGWR